MQPLNFQFRSTCLFHLYYPLHKLDKSAITLIRSQNVRAYRTHNMSGCGSFSGVSDFFSTLSICSWICAQLPQIYTNYKNKSTDGISLTFLALWFAGDFLSFTSCLLNEVVLKFQVYLSLFFLCNDITLFFQYYYYMRETNDYRRVSATDQEVDEFVLHSQQTLIHKDSEPHITDGTHRAIPTPDTVSSSPTGSYNSTDNLPIISSVAAASFIKGGNASNLEHLEARSESVKEVLGVVLAWGCTFVYMASRCPQLYKNYQRKSVDGISPLLFGAALIGNITYTLSILTSCDFVIPENRHQFFVKEIPYILGSAGTIVFDLAYFVQRRIYRKPAEPPILLSDWTHN